MKLREICSEIVFANSCMFHAVYYPTDATELYCDMLFRNRNENFNDILPKNGERVYIEGRKIPLTGSEELEGNHFVFVFNENRFQVLLYTFDGIAEIEKFILSDKGILNPFITSLIPIAYGKAISYTIRFIHTETKEWQTLNLAEYKRNRYIPAKKIGKKKVVWLPNPS